MKDSNPLDPDELFDSVTDSLDNYVPDTTSCSDSDSDYGVSAAKTKRKFSDELNTDGPDPVSHLESEPTTADKVQSLSAIPSAADKPSSSSQNAADVVVKAYNNKAGNRIYNKRHYCLYCSKPFAKMARHLERSHASVEEVASALSFPKGSKERKYQLDYIRNRGNYAHNVTVMESGSGELVPFKRPTMNRQSKDVMHCAYCQGLFMRWVLWKHIRNCRFKPQSVQPQPGRNRIQSMCAYTGPVPSNMTKQLLEIISVMTPDPVTDIIKNDKVITEIGQHLLNKGGLSDSNKQYVKDKMRELARLVYSARRVTSLKTLEDCVNPKKYMETVKAVKHACGYDSVNNWYSIPSLATKLGNSLVKVSKLLKVQGLITNDPQCVKNASEFLEVHQSKWSELISPPALRNVPALMPFVEDVQKLHTYMGQQQEKWFDTLSKSPSTKAWMELTKVCLTQTILLNRHREGEVSSMPLTAFTSRDKSEPHNDVDWAFSEVEKKLCGHFSRVVTRDKRGRPVPVLLTPKVQQALDLLVEQREACSVLKDNVYMFARPEAMSHFRGSDCLREFSKLCGAERPKVLTSARLRKKAANLSTVLNMTDTEMGQLSSFLGHHVRICREFSRLPQKTLQLAKISKLLTAFEEGRLAEFHGKTLDEIGIDPDEKVESVEENGNTEEELSSSAVGETSEVAPSPPEHIPPPHKKQKPSSEKMSSGTSAVSSSGKGKNQKKKKKRWQPTEVQAVERHLQRFITAGVVPSKRDCDRCLDAEPEALINRDWRNVKFYVYNRLTALKKKLQSS